MKNQKGITLTSLGIYVVICILVVAMLATITANYKGAIKSMDNEAEYSSEYSKFNLYFLEEVKKQENQKKPTITKENNNLIVMNMEEYKRKMLQKDIEKHLLKAEEDIEKGRTRSARKVFKEWKEKYGI